MLLKGITPIYPCFLLSFVKYFTLNELTAGTGANQKGCYINEKLCILVKTYQ